MKPNFLPAKGISLVETLVSVLLFTFIIGGLFSVIMAGNVSWQRHQATMSAQRQARNAMIMIARDFRSAKNLQLTQSSSVVDAVFNHASKGQMTYSWTTLAGANVNRVIRTLASPAETRIIAQDISSFRITEATNDFTIDLTARSTSGRQTSTFRLKERVAKR